ncbi:MAG: circularly permuted type 2 ATP-grasp protein [Pseudomonadota bacterium]
MSSLPATQAKALLPQAFDLAEPAAGDSWDECRDADGSLRPVWRRFFDAAPALHDDLAQVFERQRVSIAQQIRADGVTHNLHAADASQPIAARPWSLEALPLIIEPADWALIERGVLQRARLLGTMLADLYGPQRLLHEALLPPALVFRHSGYLRPLHGVAPVGGMHLHIVAFDVARGPDGRWWVISQRTQSPSGLGYVLHNRLIVSRLFPEAFRELRVQHIASGYRRLLDTVQQQAGEVAARLGDGSTPRVALLTPGPYSETYFEHAYLARYLGLPLVEGADLTVRGERLFLRTVEGLQPVHGLLRRLDDDYCDPLELRPDSALGVPGLVQVLRAQNLVLANALGSGFLESSAVQGFLPAICRKLLGDELSLPSLATWWCGEEAAWQAVRGDLDGLVLRPAFSGSGEGARRIGAFDTAAIQQRIEADPGAYTVQGHLPPSRAALPLPGGRLSARPALLRVYAIADAAERWHVLPGGLTRVATRAPLSVSMAQGGTSLDTWVLTDGPVDTFSMLPQRLGLSDLAARRPPVASRTAENLFWLGRYTERTEQAVRLARAALDLVDGDDEVAAPLLAAMSELIESQALVPAGTPGAERSTALFERNLLAALTQRDAGIDFNLQALARVAGALRERLSPEQWGLVRRMGDDFHGHFEALRVRVPSAAQALPALQRLTLQLAAVTGTQTDRMTRDHGWRLLSVGRLIERMAGMAATLATLLQAFDPRGGSAATTELLLELFDSRITFRARYQRHEDLLALADLLVQDDSNPRAFAGTLRRLRTELGKLPGSDEARSALREMLPPHGAGLSLAQLVESAGADDALMRRQLLQLAQRLQASVARLSDAIGQRYFAHADGTDGMQRV